MSDEIALTETDRRALLSLARISIRNRLTGREFPLPERTPSLERKVGAFVTLRIPATGEGKHLRGCIGHIITNDGLYDTVRIVAVSSAIGDARFPPLKEEELAEVAIEISVLSPLVRIDDPMKVEPGIHGVYVRRRDASGLLLPQVATEYGWDRDTLLRHTCLKAGLPADCLGDKEVELSIFTAVVFDEYSLGV